MYMRAEDMLFFTRVLETLRGKLNEFQNRNYLEVEPFKKIN